jgi:myosin heavy subunit
MKGFKYDKFKEEMEGGDSWGSYSDLFMVLSFVFLMMYVVSSLRSGTNSIQQRITQQKMVRENSDLKAQMKAYDTLKDQAVKEESKDEQEVYQELMNKLSLLQEEAKDEKDNLRRQAVENEKKEMALNRYQQIVRNIINANMLAKNKLKVREKIIANKNETISDLNEEVEEKEREIRENNQQISKITRDLNQNIQNLKSAQANNKITKEKAYKQIALLKLKSQKQIEELNKENRQVQTQLAQITNELDQTSDKLEVTENKNQELSKDLAETSEKLVSTVGQYEEQIKNLQQNHTAKMASERAAFNKRVQAANLSAQEKARQLAEFNRQAAEKAKTLGSQIASLKDELTEAQERENAKSQENAKLAGDLKATSDKLQKTVGDYEGQLKGLAAAHEAKMAKEKAAFEGKLNAANLSGLEKARQLADFNRAAKEKDEAMGREMGKLKGELADAQARADARAKLSREIAAALKKAGVEADVNPNTGDVVVSFGKDYFDSGSSNLKPTMADVLKKFIPKYSESLFKDPKIASKITSVDIIGFASPTYKGKYIDPQSLDSEDQNAAKYNLDLSYNRARAIFDYMFFGPSLQRSFPGTQKNLEILTRHTDLLVQSLYS